MQKHSKLVDIRFHCHAKPSQCNRVHNAQNDRIESLNHLMPKAARYQGYRHRAKQPKSYAAADTNESEKVIAVGRSSHAFHLHLTHIDLYVYLACVYEQLNVDASSHVHAAPATPMAVAFILSGFPITSYGARCMIPPVFGS